MMNTQKAIIYFLCFTSAFILTNSLFNFMVDAECFYRCPEISLSKRTTNIYYQAGQRALAYPDTEVVVLGSSRGETVSPEWIEKLTTKKAINLSVSGADLLTKSSLLNFAIANSKINTVIWLADYFDLTLTAQDRKIKRTPSLRKYLLNSEEEGALSLVNRWFGLIDHNSTSASLRFLKKYKTTEIGRGGNVGSNFMDCAQESYKGIESREKLKSKIDILYKNYTNGVIDKPQEESQYLTLENQLKLLDQKGIQVFYIITPYHPQFTQRLKNEYPRIYQNHIEWIRRVSRINLNHVKVINAFTNSADDDGSPKYWNDGVHYSCYLANQLLKDVIK